MKKWKFKFKYPAFQKNQIKKTFGVKNEKMQIQTPFKNTNKGFELVAECNAKSTSKPVTKRKPSFLVTDPFPLSKRPWPFLFLGPPLVWDMIFLFQFSVLIIQFNKDNEKFIYFSKVSIRFVIWKKDLDDLVRVHRSEWIKRSHVVKLNDLRITI